MTAETELLRFIESDFALDGAPVSADTDLLLTGLIDSLGVMRIVEWLERAHEIEIPPQDVVLENFRSVIAMVDYVGRRSDAVSR